LKLSENSSILEAPPVSKTNKALSLCLLIFIALMSPGFNYTMCHQTYQKLFQCVEESRVEESTKIVTKISNGQAKNKDGVVKMTVSNGLIKNNFSYATVMTMSSEDKEKMSSNPLRPPHNGEMFGMKFRDRELPAPPLENDSSMESTTKKTSMETTTRKSSVETTSKTTSETVKKMQVLPPHLMSPHNLRANGRLPSCLEVSGQPWYKPVDRKTAEEMVRKVGQNGCFLVRDSRHGGADSPLTLTLFNNDKVFNISIRLRADGKVALGKEKPDELGYKSVVAMIAHHKIDSLTLTAGSSQQEHSKTRLTEWPSGGGS